MSRELDPTRTMTTREQAGREFRKRWRLAKNDIIAYLETLPRKQYKFNWLARIITNAPAPYVFDISTDRIQAVQDEIKTILDKYLASDNWLGEFTQETYLKGASQAIMTLKPQAALAKRDIDLTLTEQFAIRERALRVGARAFEEINWLARTETAKLGRLLSRAILDGDPISSVTKEVAQSFGVAEYIGERIARTEITQALKKARLDEGEIQSARVGLQVKFMHTSAFSPTSRLEHMQRHGNVYTVQEIKEWYGVNGNAINCLCSMVEVLLDEDGQPLAPNLIQRAKQIKEKHKDKLR